MITNITQYRAHQHSNVHKRKFEALSGKTQGAFIRNGVEIGLAAVAPLTISGQHVSSALDGGRTGTPIPNKR